MGGLRLMEIVALQAMLFDGHLYGGVFQHAPVVGFPLEFQPQILDPVGLLDEMVERGRPVRRHFHFDVQMIVEYTKAVHMMLPTLLPLASRLLARHVVGHVGLKHRFRSGPRPDVVFVDQVSACVPVLRRIPFCKVVFYCHYPDRLLAAHDGSLKRFYRRPLDWLEERTTAMADVLLVNSRFTLSVFRSTFRSIEKSPEVVYPSINTASFDNTETVDLPANIDGPFVLSVNRFERKKNLGLAVRALSLLPDKNVRLVLAGGYDPLNVENIEYFKELVDLVNDMELGDRVTFLKSPSDVVKISLLRRCSCLVYTPSNEHFGIVPLEAMYCGKPVVAVNNGGPKETIDDGHNGYLRYAEPEEFADAIKQLVEDEQTAEQFGKRGRKRFDEMFSFAAFKKNINTVLVNLYRPK